MTVHTIHIFDRRGKTLFSKTYSSAATQEIARKTSACKSSATPLDNSAAASVNPVDEQRKLVFGMLFSIRELMGTLCPEKEEDSSLHFIRTGACTLHYYETTSGLRLALYTSNDTPFHNVSVSSSLSSNKLSSLATTGGVITTTAGEVMVGTRDALRHIYLQLWVDSVIHCPSHRPGKVDAVESTNFEKRLDAYLTSMPWFR